ncbi:hypothetical protein [Streptomyces sp. NPDC093591]|uniref:hypothetical protein n=1 Tax=Streptomyces sp. NPDC093591 TaxID=3366044 RepID=UPI0037F588A1
MLAQLAPKIVQIHELIGRTLQQLATLDGSQYTLVPGSRSSLETLSSAVATASVAATDLASAVADNPLEGAVFADGPPLDEDAVRKARHAEAAPRLAEALADAAHDLDLCATCCLYTASGILRDLKEHPEHLPPLPQLTSAQYTALEMVAQGGASLIRSLRGELVNSGLPIHIGAALLGHLNVQTTRGYVAVFDEDVIRHYQEHLEHRRQIRPTDEYRDTTSNEWAEFEEHFDRRKVELGSCGRPYGTPCQHEHACIRCPMLHVNPKMLARLSELEADLLQRRTQAEAEGWIGEIEGIDLPLTFLRAKRDETQRRAQRPAVHLGIPARRRPQESE